MSAASILIVNWNDRDRLARCLAALSNLDAEILVVDNASSDGSAEMVSSRYPRVHLLASASNLGFGAGVNAAARVATSAYLLMLNPDVTAEAESVAALAGFLDEHPRIAAVAGVLVGPDGRPQHGWNVRRLPTPLAIVSELLLVDRVWPRNPVTVRHHALDLDPRCAAEVEQPAGACLMIRRSSFEAVGGFDERFHPAWFEDVDLCARLRDAGARLFYLPTARFRHDGGSSVEKLSRREAAWFYYRNLLRYADKHWGGLRLVAIRVALAFGMALRAAVSLATADREGASAYGGVMVKGGFPCSPRKPWRSSAS